MIVRRLDQIENTDRDVRAETFASRRFLLAGDGVGFSFHDTILHAGSTTWMWYRHHIESVYCIEGEGELTDLETGACHRIEPGVLYVLDGHERHELKALTRLRMICVFNPPLVGNEVHGEDGSYPLMDLAGMDPAREVG